MRRILLNAVLVGVFAVPQLDAQFSFGLPKVDGLSTFYRYGRIPSANPWQMTHTAPCGNWSRNICGWGFETWYDMTPASNDKEALEKAARDLETKADAIRQEAAALTEEAAGLRKEAETSDEADAKQNEGQAKQKEAQAAQMMFTASELDATAEQKRSQAQKKTSPWNAELALGYDFLNVQAQPRRNQDVTIYGSVQTLPSATLYVSYDFGDHPYALYGGIGTGFVVLKNMKAVQRNQSGESVTFPIAGDTWGLSLSLGESFQIPRSEARLGGVSTFFEIAYEVRHFPSLAYTVPSGATLPKELTPNLTFSGFVVNAGVQLRFRKDSGGK